ncbi:hypothetical protein E1189_02475 [Sansalvadorimonas verongulae]|nr:hypothetical protein [Sansalvadorimonas verongulae]
MSDEITGCCERSIALILVTDKGLVSLNAFVPDEITGLGKTLVASVQATDKGPVPCVDRRQRACPLCGWACVW